MPPRKQSEAPRAVPSSDVIPPFDPAKLARDALASNLDLSGLSEIDERHIPRATNWLEWATGKQFLNLPRLFAKQVEISLNFLGQFCPRCTDQRYLVKPIDSGGGGRVLCLPTAMAHNDVLSSVQVLINGVCPKCNVGRNELLRTRELRHFTELVGCAGMRASKSTMVAMLATYQLHRYLTVPNPARYFDLLPNQNLHMTFIALTAKQAEENLWQPFCGLIDGSPWFQHYHAFLKEQEKRLGRKLFKWRDTFFHYMHKHLGGGYFGADIGTIRGRTRIFTAIDEIGYFDANMHSMKIKKNAKQTHVALAKSLATVRSKASTYRKRGDNDPLDAFDCNISSPADINDPIMQLLRDAWTDHSKYGFHYETFDINPDITVESLQGELSDPKEFDRQYRAIPPIGNNPFITNEPGVMGMQREMKQGVHPTVRWEKKELVDALGYRSVYLEVTPEENMERPRLLTIDAGYNNCSFAVSVSSFNRESNQVDVELILELQPVEGQAMAPVNFPKMYEHCLVPLIKKLNVIQVEFDRWQHLDHMTRIRQELSVHADPRSLRLDDFLNFQARIASASVTIPRAEMKITDVRGSKIPIEELLSNAPVMTAIMQTLTVRRVGNVIAKPSNGNDDVFRTLVLAVTHILNPDNTMRFTAYGAATSRGRSGGALGVYRSYAGSSPVQSARGASGNGAVIGVRRRRNIV